MTNEVTVFEIVIRFDNGAMEISGTPDIPFEQAALITRQASEAMQRRADWPPDNRFDS